MGTEETRAITEAIHRVLASGQWILGPNVEAFEAEFGAYLGHEGREVVGVANGTDALTIAFASLELTRDSVVLVAADEGGYAASAAQQAGLRVRVMDIDADLGVPTASTAQAAYSTDVSAVVITHLHGNAVPLAEIDRWRRTHGIALVEDCAQAHGLRIGGQHVGGTGDAATFSFYPTKNLGAVGDAGAVLLSESAAKRARMVRQYGWGTRYRIDRRDGQNSRLDELQAAVLRVRLPRLDAANARRREIASCYRQSVPLLNDVETTVAHHAVALFGDRAERDHLRERLTRAGVGTAVHYPYLVQEMPGLGLEAIPTPQAAARRDRTLTLPCYPGMTTGEIDHVLEALS